MAVFLFFSQNDLHFRYFFVGLAAYRSLCAFLFSGEKVDEGVSTCSRTFDLGEGQSDRTGCGLRICPC
jgi:hypothetical protein